MRTAVIRLDDILETDEEILSMLRQRCDAHSFEPVFEVH